MSVKEGHIEETFRGGVAVNHGGTPDSLWFPDVSAAIEFADLIRKVAKAAKSGSVTITPVPSSHAALEDRIESDRILITASR